MNPDRPFPSWLDLAWGVALLLAVGGATVLLAERLTSDPDHVTAGRVLVRVDATGRFTLRHGATRRAEIERPDPRLLLPEERALPVETWMDPDDRRLVNELDRQEALRALAAAPAYRAIDGVSRLVLWVEFLEGAPASSLRGIVRMADGAGIRRLAFGDPDRSAPRCRVMLRPPEGGALWPSLAGVAFLRLQPGDPDRDNGTLLQLSAAQDLQRVVRRLPQAQDAEPRRIASPDVIALEDPGMAAALRAHCEAERASLDHDGDLLVPLRLRRTGMASGNRAVRGDEVVRLLERWPAMPRIHLTLRDLAW